MALKPVELLFKTAPADTTIPSCKLILPASIFCVPKLITEDLPVLESLPANLISPVTVTSSAIIFATAPPSTVIDLFSAVVPLFIIIVFVLLSPKFKILPLLIRSPDQEPVAAIDSP